MEPPAGVFKNTKVQNKLSYKNKFPRVVLPLSC